MRVSKRKTQLPRYCRWGQVVVFCLATGLATLVTFVLIETCSLAGEMAQYLAAYLAAQIQALTGVDRGFCSGFDIDFTFDDTVANFDGSVVNFRSNATDATNTTGGAKDDDGDGCLTFIEDFCKPYVKPLFHETSNLFIGAGIVVLAQIHFAFLAIERYRVVTPIGHPDAAQQRPEHTEAEPIEVKTINPMHIHDRGLIVRPLLFRGPARLALPSQLLLTCALMAIEGTWS